MTSTAGSSSRRRTLALRGVLGAAALALTLLFASRIGWRELGLRLRSAEALPLAAAGALLLCRWAIWAGRWRMALRRVVGAQPASRAFLAVMASVFVNLVSPWIRLLGGLSRARFIAGATKQPFARVYGTVLYDQLVHHGAVIAITWIALIGGLVAVGRPTLGLGAAVLLVVTLVVLVVLARRSSTGPNPIVAFLEKHATERPGRSGRWAAHGHEAVTHFSVLLRDRKLHAPALALSVAMFLAGATGQWAVFVALDRPVGIWAVVAVVALGNAAGLLSGSPGGVGTTEAAMIGCYVMLGVSQLDAVAATFLFRGLHYLLVLGVGLPALLRFEVAQRG